jgi:2,3-bisphosphoglycerate-dependent phosphoglycerate mutase
VPRGSLWPAELWLVRHAESAGNVARDAAEAAALAEIDIADRDMDVALSRRGEQQAAALGAWFGSLGDDGPDVVLSSPYRRAADTAAGVVRAAHLEVPIVLDERLRERDLGMLDRLTHRGIVERFPEQSEARARLGKFYYRPPGGESWTDVALRARSAIDTIAREYDGSRVMVVAHEVVILMFRYVLEHLDERALLELNEAEPLANCSVGDFVFDDADGGGMRLRSWGRVEAADAPVTRETDEARAPR